MVMRTITGPIVAAGLVTLLSAGSVSAQTAGAAGSFAIVGGTAVSANGVGSSVNGDVGVSPGTSITGFPGSASTVPPYSTHSNDGAAIAAQAATLSLYNFLAAAPGATVIPAQLNGQLRGPGTYSFVGGAADLAALGTLTLSGAGVYIFQVGSALTANVGSSIALLGGADACNIYWQVTSAATLNGTNFAGNVVAQAAVTLGTGDTLTGRALTTSLGAVTLTSTNSVGGCSSAAVAPTPTPNPTPTVNACAATAPELFIAKTHSGSFAVGTNAVYSIALGNNGVTSVGPITVTDTLPSTLRFVSAAGPGWTCAQAGQVVTCTSAAALPGVITVTANPTVDAVPGVTNNATVSASDRAVVAVAVPTLPEWAFLMLAALLTAAGAIALRRRQSAV